MSRRKVLVKRLVCIEDLGDVDVLFTDKTGTLTMGRIDYMRAVPAEDAIDPDDVLRWGLLCTESAAADGRQASAATRWIRPCGTRPPRPAQRPALADYTRLAVLPFDHERRWSRSSSATSDSQLTLVTKGAPETVLAPVPRRTATRHADRLADGVRRGQPRRRRRHPRRRRRAPAVRRATSGTCTSPGLLVFLDPPKARRRRGAAPAGQPRHRGQGRHRRQPRRRRQGLPRPRAAATVPR